jgi:hypothetical protein
MKCNSQEFQEQEHYRHGFTIFKLVWAGFTRLDTNINRDEKCCRIKSFTVQSIKSGEICICT